MLAFRYQPHDEPLHRWFGEPTPDADGEGGLPVGWSGQPTPSGSFEEIVPRLAPETLELLEWKGEGRKAIAEQAVVRLSPPAGAAQRPKL